VVGYVFVNGCSVMMCVCACVCVCDCFVTIFRFVRY